MQNILEVDLLEDARQDTTRTSGHHSTGIFDDDSISNPDSAWSFDDVTSQPAEFGEKLRGAVEQKTTSVAPAPGSREKKKTSGAPAPESREFDFNKGTVPTTGSKGKMTCYSVFRTMLLRGESISPETGFLGVCSKQTRLGEGLRGLVGLTKLPSNISKTPPFVWLTQLHSTVHFQQT